MSTNPWVILRLRVRSGTLFLEFADSRGRDFDFPFPAGNQWLALFRTLLNELPANPRLAIFLDPEVKRAAGAGLAGAKRSARESATLQVLSLLRETRSALGPDADLCEPVYLVRGPWPERRHFELPLDILTVGAATTWLDRAIASRKWLAKIEDTGLTAAGNWKRELLERSWRGRETDVIICAAADLPRLSIALRVLSYVPRLLVVLISASSWQHPVRLARHKLPVGTSLLLMAAGGELGPESEAIVELIRDFAHDQPLHLWGRRIDRYDDKGRRPSALFSQPKALNALRLSDALIGITEDVLSLPFTATAGAVEKLPVTAKTSQLREALRVDRWRSLEFESISEFSYGSFDSKDAGGAFFDEAIKSIESFKNESDALISMAAMRKALAEEKKIQADAQSVVAGVIEDPELREAYLGQQARTVDVTLRRLSQDGVAGPFITRYEALVLLARYRVRVQIGRRSSVSIVSGEVPPIDLLLPPPEKGRRHVLHIAFYTDDFVLTSPILQRIDLPEIGPSPAIDFDVAPRPGVRTAKARIAIYYDLPPEGSEGEMRNHLVQTFMLTAQVRASENETPAESGVEVALEFSLNARFSQLEALNSRLVSLALNDGATAGSHKLMMKRAGNALPLNFTETQISKSLKNIRETLDWASCNDARDGPRFPADQTEGDEAEFDEVIRRVAIAGRSLYVELFGAALGTPLEEALSAASRTSDHLIQAVHLARNYAFPWTAVYDFSLPPSVIGGAVLPICKGFRRKNPDRSPFSCAQCLSKCLHPDKRGAICVYGFWGTRHQIEQLVAEKINKPEQLQPIGPGAVAFTMGITGRYLQEIPVDLTKKLGASVRQIPDQEDFLPTLWTDRRPAVLLLVGHYRTEDIDKEPKGPRLTIAGERFLTPDDIIQQRIAHSEDWTDPRTVVLLAACSGGVVDISSGANFVNLFTGVGAGAVIGPEAIIYEGLARRFAVEMSEALVRGDSVGTAVLAFRRGLLQDLNPLGLVITSYGFADLAAPRQPAATS